MPERKRLTACLLCGLLGCLCFGGGDWLMIYGDTAYTGTLSWLTEGVGQIPAWRNSLAMGLSFPGIVLYSAALFAIGQLLQGAKRRRLYHAVTALSLTPWIALHLFYIMIFFAFAWMRGNGYGEAALPVAEALYGHFAWIVPVSEIMMLPPYLYLFGVTIRGHSVMPKWMALNHPLIFYAVLKIVTAIMPDGAFRLAFINGLMSESMAIWFILLLSWRLRQPDNPKDNKAIT